MDELTHSAGGTRPPCDVCGERPAAVGVIMATPTGRRRAMLCERCAHDAMGTGAQDSRSKPKRETSETAALDEFGRDLTADARAGKLDPVIGRDEEIQQAIEILSRRRKNNVVLIGEAGVGKTAIAEGLALRIAEGTVPEQLGEARIVALDLPATIAGSQFRGQFEQRLKSILDEVIASNGRILLFIDEVHTLLGAGNAEGGMDAASMLKPMLARGELRVIGATTLAEYRKIERDSALARRFSAVTVEEPSIDETVLILRGLRPGYEEHHGVAITDEAVEAAARLSDRYITEYHLPDKAIDLVDQASARVRLMEGGSAESLGGLRRQLDAARQAKDAAVAEERYEQASELKQRCEELEARVRDLEGSDEQSTTPAGGTVVGEQEIAAVVAARTGIPVGELVAGELERLTELESDLHQRVIGQNQAVEVVSDTIRRARVGLSEGDKPLGTFLFLGPTGVGKTELVKALSERLFASEKALVRIDMSEFREPHTVARLIGSPPGYVGYGDGGQLTEPVRRRPYSVILLDEIEKAHPDVWNVLLQVMDDGRLTDGEGRTVDFTNTVLVMTSNLGAGKSKRGLGFTAAGAAPKEERMLAAAKSAFLPEFLNRIDEIVTFQPLTEDEVQRICGLICEQVADRLRAEHAAELVVEEPLRAKLATDGFDEEFGARPLKRHVRRTLERELTRAILDGTIVQDSKVVARVGDEGAVALTVSQPGRALQKVA
jgi:ATP-dependent Clp protease ATP-binding subunit ClpC